MSDASSTPGSRSASPPKHAAPFGAIILAAGASTRLGQPKQLLHYEGAPLVIRAAQAALAAGAFPVVTVLGANAEKIRPVLGSLPVVIAENPHWSEGMASSIRCGLAALETTAAPASISDEASAGLSHPLPAAAPSTPDAVLIALCDQPHFSASAITRLHAALATHMTIAATRHADSAGVPAIFRRIHFPALHALRGSEGARRVIAAHTATTARVDLPELALDIDTPADWQRLNSR